MNKFYKVVFLAAALLVSGCSKDDGGNSPLIPPVSEVTKGGAISDAEVWSEAGKVYRVTAECFINASVTWQKGIVVVVDSAAVIHIGNNGVLTIEENVTVKSGNGSYIDVGDLSTGSLIATGSASAPITFTTNTGVQSWGLRSASQSGGIVLGDSAGNVHLNYCTITGATAGIYVKAGFPLITNCRISSCEGDGIFFDSTAGPGDSLNFTNNTISDCGGYPLTLPANRLADLSGDITFSVPQGGKSAIRVLGGIVGDTAAVWRKMAIPYVFDGMTVIGSFSAGVTQVIIMPGVVCTFEKDACIRVGDPRFGVGILIARGTPTDSIFFVNNQPNTVWGDSTGGASGSVRNLRQKRYSITVPYKTLIPEFLSLEESVSPCRIAG